MHQSPPAIDRLKTEALNRLPLSFAKQNKVYYPKFCFYFFFVKKKKNQQSLLSLQKQSKTFKAKPYIAKGDVKVDRFKASL